MQVQLKYIHIEKSLLSLVITHTYLNQIYGVTHYFIAMAYTILPVSPN